MKKMLSLLLSLLMLAAPLLGAAEAAPAKSVFDWLWEQYDLSFLTEQGILTEEEARLLTAEKDAVSAGRELVSTMRLTAEGITDDPAADAAIAELLDALTVTTRVQRDEAVAVVSLSGQDVLSAAYGERDGAAYLSSGLLESPITLTAAELDDLLLRLVNAAQSAGLIGGDQAMEYGYNLGLYPMSYMMSSMPLGWTLQEKIDPASLDLTAWNEAIAPIEARRVATPVIEQPGDCDETVETWTVDVTPEDLNALLTASLRVVRDNPVLCDAIADSIGYNRYAPSGSVRSFEQELDDMIIASQETPLNTAGMLRLTGWTDAAGDLTRLVVYVLDTDVDEEAVLEDMQEAADEEDGQLAAYFEDFGELKQVVLTITHTRSTADDATTWKTMFGSSGDLYDTGLAFTLIKGEGVWYAGMSLIDSGVTEASYSLGVNYQLTRADGVTGIIADAAVTIFDAMGTVEIQTQPLTAALDAQIMADSYHVDASVQLADMNEAGEALTITLVSDCAVDGPDIAGTDNVVATLGGKRVTATVQTRTQEPQSSVFDGDAVRLADLPDEELTAWLTGVVERAQDCLTQTLPLLPEGIRDAMESYGE